MSYCPRLVPYPSNVGGLYRQPAGGARTGRVRGPSGPAGTSLSDCRRILVFPGASLPEAQCGIAEENADQRLRPDGTQKPVSIGRSVFPRMNRLSPLQACHQDVATQPIDYGGF